MFFKREKDKKNLCSITKSVLSITLCAAILLSMAACVPTSDPEAPSDTSSVSQKGPLTGNSSNDNKSEASSKPDTDIKTAEVNNEEFDKYCDDLFKLFLEDDPFSAHYLVTDASDYGVEFDSDDYTIGEVTLESEEEAVSQTMDCLNELRGFDKEELTAEQQITYDIIEAYFETQLAYEGSSVMQNIFSPMQGVAANLADNFTNYTFYEKDDVDDYLLFLKDVERYMGQCCDFLDEQSKKGYFMSDEIADKAIDTCRQHMDGDGEQLISSFNEKIEKLDISSSDKKKYKQQNEDYIKKHYTPSFKKVIDKITELKGTGKNDGGLCGYGDEGLSYYEALIKDNTSSNMTPKELASFLDNYMISIMADLFLTPEEGFDEAENYDMGMDTAEEMLNFLIENVEKDFPKPVTTQYDVQYLPESSETENITAYYVLSRIDDISENNIRVNRSAVKDDQILLYTTLAHEGFPGHLYQHTACCKDSNLPNIRKNLDFIGATEGWAQYVGNCSLDYLDLSEDAKSALFINDILSYVVISRVDVGVNYEGWDMQDTYDYLSTFYEVDDNFEDEDNLVAEFYYMVIADPASFIPYTIGYIKMIEMRNEAEDELGSDFDAVSYHEWLIGMGAAPFEVYESQLAVWLNSQKTSDAKNTNLFAKF
ncbi:MAG: DUF885 domain-containing protein [Lachnospiraceae bacterium]|nr:DUF885 domain-containing protein [Lachnospiraceae bacterium]